MALELVTIPTEDNPDYTTTVVLEGIAYDIRMQWNGRDETWYMYFGLADQPSLFTRAVSNGTDILLNYKAYNACPKGVLYVYDSVKKNGRLQYDSFSSGRFKLYYMSKELRDLLKSNPNLLK